MGADMIAGDRSVRGQCPMGCGATLFVGSGGYITCSLINCPQPDAVAALLDDSETHHVVVFREDDFTLRHPLRERIGDELMECEMHARLASLDGPPVLGRYRIIERPSGRLIWEPLGA